MSKKEPRSYTHREPKEFNKIRAFFQWLTCSVVYGGYYKVACGLKIYGRENVPKKGFFIVASNHMSAIDPFLIIAAIRRPIAYMAKKELFEKPCQQPRADFPYWQIQPDARSDASSFGSFPYTGID